MSAPLRLETTLARRYASLTRFLVYGGAIAFTALLVGVTRAFDWSFGAALIPTFAIWTVLRPLLRMGPGRRGEVRVDADGIHFAGHLLPRGAMAAGYYTPAVGKTAPHVKLMGRRNQELARIDVADGDEAHLLLDALGLGAEQRAAQFKALAPLDPRLALAVVACFALAVGLLFAAIAFQSGWIALAALVAGGAGVGILFLGCEVNVGADGLLIRHRLGSRFVPWARVTSIQPSARGVLLKLRRGSIELPLTIRSELDGGDLEEVRAALVERARAARAAHRRAADVDVAARVARRGRSPEAWFRQLFERAGDYRAAPLLADQLWRIVESPAAEPTARAGAAALLAQSAGGEERARLRIAADACAAPALRVVLAKAADGAPEETLREALAELEDEAVDASVRAKRASARRR